MITYFIRFKNPAFIFDQEISAWVFFALIRSKLFSLIRGNLYLLLRLKSPSSIFFGKNVSFLFSSKIRFGKFIQVGDYAFFSALGKEGITLGNNVSIGAYSRLVVSTSFSNIGNYIRIGNDVGLGEFAYLGGGGGLEIGNDCIIGQYLSCHPENHLINDITMNIRNSGVSRKGICIGNNCWIGAKVTILDGVTIGNNCVIAAGSVVNKNFANGSVIAGVPAKLIKRRYEEQLTSPNAILPVNPELYQ